MTESMEPEKTISSKSDEAPPQENQGESRRNFIKKLTYATPVLTTYLLDETAFAKDDKDKDKDKTSPTPRGRGR